MKPDTGGPAYPCKREIIPPGDNRKPYEVNYEGTTLLDCFAGQAMPEIQRQHPDAQTVAVLAYEQAKEMVAEKRRLEE